jgi:hypothetical protein
MVFGKKVSHWHRCCQQLDARHSKLYDLDATLSGIPSPSKEVIVIGIGSREALVQKTKKFCVQLRKWRI